MKLWKGRNEKSKSFETPGDVTHKHVLNDNVNNTDTHVVGAHCKVPIEIGNKIKNKRTWLIMPLFVLFMLICVIAIFVVETTIGYPTDEPQLSEIPTVIEEDEEIFASTTTVEHVCSNYYISKYDTTNHWNECSICGKKYNVVVHTYTENWTMGESCSPSNKCNHVCSCGYSYQTNNTREHTPRNMVSNPSQYYHEQTCSVCNATIISRQTCTKEDGSKITCQNLGTCVICNCTYTRSNHSGAISKNGDAKCQFCSIYIGTVSNLKTSYPSSNIFELSYDLSIASSGNFDSASLGYYISTGCGMESNTKTYNNSTSIHVVTKVNRPNYENRFNVHSHVGNYYASEGELVSLCNIAINNVSPDIEPPVINPDIVQTDLATSNDWATQKQITVSGTENFCSSVKLTLKDSEGNTYLNNAATTVTNNGWSYTFVPDIEASGEGKQFTIIVTDNLGNSAEKTFTVEKTDKKAPTITSATETSEDWTKTKPFTFTATDEGSGGVSIAINNTNDYTLATKSGTTYSRDYIFTEEIYGSKNVTIYFKDALGNATTQNFKVYNIDITKPTITKYEIINNEIVLTGNDRNATLNKEGSGIAKYRYIGSSDEDVDVGAGPVSGGWKETTSNKIPLSELKNVKYAYIVAIDGAGNVSEKQKIQLPTYKITVNPNGGTWKGVNTNTEEVGYYNGQTIRIEPPTRQGYTFEGWEVTQGTMNGSKTEYTFTTSNATLQAKWSLITPEVGNNIETVVTANKMDENGTPILTKENGEISYRISYTTVITNYIGKAKIEIVSTLPAKINTDKSELAGGRYNETNKTITWTEEIENINTFSNGNYIREIPKQITLVYENQNVVRDLTIITTGKTITYYPTGYLDKGGQEFIKAEKTKETVVKQDYKVNFKTIVNWEDNNNMKGKRPENVTIEIVVEAVGAHSVRPLENSLTKVLNQENNWTYEEKGLPKYNAEGEKITYEITQKETKEGDLEYYEEAEITKGETQDSEEANYIYTITNEYKLMETDLNTELTLNGTEEIQEKESEISYTINLKSEISNYIGEGKIKIVDTLPYEIDTEKSDIANGTYDEANKTITWEEELPHINTDEAKENYKIDQTKNIKLIYKDIDLEEEKMTNEIKAKIELYETEEKDEETANCDTKINVQGKVVVKYIDKDTNQEIIKIGKADVQTNIEDGENLEDVDDVGASIARPLEHDSNNNDENQTYGYEIIGKIGTEYETEQKEIEGYDYIESIGNETGKIKEKDTEVIYYYQVPRTKVIVKYQDREGNDIIEKTEINGLLGDKYKTEKKEIEKYTYLEQKGNEEGEMTREEIEIIYIYEKTGTLKVKYIDIDTNQEIIKIGKADVQTNIENGENLEDVDDVGASIARPPEHDSNNNDDNQTYAYEIIGLVGDKYETEQKEILYYVYVNSTENTKGELKEEDTVEYYYRKQDFNIGIEKEIESIQLNGEEIEITNKKLAKIEIKSKEVDKTNLIVNYNIKVTNKGELEGTATIEEQIPQGYEFVGINEGASVGASLGLSNWQQKSNGILETEIELESGEIKNLELTLRWKNSENNLGSRTSTTKIASTQNQANYKDTNEKDDVSEATVVINIKTGEVVSTIIIVMIMGALIISSYITIRKIRRKSPEIKDIKFLK